MVRHGHDLEDECDQDQGNGYVDSSTHESLLSPSGSNMRLPHEKLGEQAHTCAKFLNFAPLTALGLVAEYGEKNRRRSRGLQHPEGRPDEQAAGGPIREFHTVFIRFFVILPRPARGI